MLCSCGLTVARWVSPGFGGPVDLDRHVADQYVDFQPSSLSHTRLPEPVPTSDQGDKFSPYVDNSLPNVE